MYKQRNKGKQAERANKDKQMDNVRSKNETIGYMFINSTQYKKE